MSVLDGPRRERRRILVDGSPRQADLIDGELVLDDGTRVDPTSATHLPPVAPRTIVCVHLNYRSRFEELGRPPAEDETPTYFIKHGGALNHHGATISRPADCQLLNYEGEIVAVVGSPMHRVAAKDVWDHLEGFSIANDYGVHDFRDTDSGSMLRVKGQAGFCPVGPGVVSGIDIRDTEIRTYVNGTLVQRDQTPNLLWGIDVLFEDLTRHLALAPGDIVLTGTPWHSRPVFPGDTVEVEVDGIGRLTNTIAEVAAPSGYGFPPTVTPTSLYVALGSDFNKLRDGDALPTAQQYRDRRDELIAANAIHEPYGAR